MAADTECQGKGRLRVTEAARDSYNILIQVRGKLIGHRIKYWMKKDNEYNSTVEVKESQYVLSRSTKSEALIIGLLPNEYYYVRVMAYNSAGW